ncbi:FtsK/SpoIIIE domain-containing protein [Mycobacterium sp. OTB74]|jgi:S-DNA-T family DNA segregation ATPase FtsK/SpoIIIE|uniref:FtsK/SpoIIIE domain-containing protein n=1 Tax=Mycobacterium sp. OTB74 TaxID=1853452 RepID=UPI0024740480|nr:FtsK/SpoIIIE domain-containing protein [Mycobacterium sp. OTB74]MDH6246231.1 S-DNA-T family DNA segregation ATPase FtsK/SpoIIIE [Mycobacterium sp. OTB74]
MQLKFILRREGGTAAHVAVTADATASVGDLAMALTIGDPDLRPTQLPTNPTLKLEHSAFDSGTAGRVIEPSRSLIDSGMRSGSTVSLAPATRSALAPSRRGRSVAVLRVLSGPDAGREFQLPPGNSVVGTALTGDVALTDPAVSPVHAAITVGESIEISSLAGPSDVVVSGRPVQRALVGVTDVVQLGNTSVAIVHTVRAGAAPADSVAIEFNRSPRVVSRFPVKQFSAPKLPQRPEPAHIPYISMLAPLALGAVMLVFTRSLIAVLFIALSPLLMVGMYVDTIMQTKKKYKQEVDRFADGLRQLAADLTAAQRLERAVRLAEAPALGETLDAIHRLGPLMWTHRPEHGEFLCVRLGLGDAESRCQIESQNDYDSEEQYTDQLTALKSEFENITEVPIVASLRECGALGLCGPRGVIDGVARGIIMQLVGLHSPAELAIAAFGSPQSRASWEWLEWLPHAGSAHSPLAGNHLTESANSGIALLSRLEELVKLRSNDDRVSAGYGLIAADTTAEPNPVGPLPAVVVLVEDTAPIDRARLTRLAERGAPVGVHVIWVATQVSSLPAACRTYLLVESASTGSTVGAVRHGTHNYPVACDSLDVPDATQVALLLAPVVDSGAAVEDATDLPRSVNYLSLTGTSLASEPNVIARQWLSSESVIARTGSPKPPSGPVGLRALVGSTGTHDFHLDLREHGPHALVGGTTGSGKSEFLQTWIMGMAAASSPDRINFLLVDYKGGTAFAECVELPHTVGLVTDLSPHLVRRALTSLGAEIKRREHLLNSKRAKDLASLEQTGDRETPPSLVIIVDEFAALATEVPEFVDGVIDVAQRGRSLGLHLILATQRPAGVIKDNLRANTNLRIALRLNDVDDSVDVIDDKQAAYFPPEIPGRAVAKTGPGRLTTFQSGYVGGWSGDQPDRTPIDICEFAFGRRRPWNTTMPGDRRSAATGPTDIARIVRSVRAASDSLRIPAPRKPWLPPLADVYPLETLTRHAANGDLVIGRADMPALQAQPVGGFSPDRDGNMAIFGTGGTGKSTALRTLAISAALAPGDGPVHVYGFDFGSGSLKMLEPLPHVGAIVSADDDERLGRVLRRLTAVMEERSRAFARVHASSISEYRKLADPAEPRILLLVDGITAFREAYEHISHSPIYPMFSQLASDGRMLGIHIVVTGDRPGALSIQLASTIQRRLVLRLASDDDYSMVNVPSDILNVNSPCGRGVMDGQELQVAVFGGDANVAAQGRAIEQLATAMREAGFNAPAPIERLPENIPLDGLPASVAGVPSVGLASETLTPIGVVPQGVLMVTGPPGSGRSTALLTLAEAVRRTNPGMRIVYMSPTPSATARRSVWSETAIGPSAVYDRASSVISSVEFGGGGTNLMVVVESVSDFSGTEAESELARMVKTLADASAFVVGESEVSTWNQAYLLAQPFKSPRRGIVLVPDGHEVDSLLNTSIGIVRQREFPPGRGVFVEKGRGVWLQMAQPGS